MDAAGAGTIAPWILPPAAVGTWTLFEVRQALDGAPRLWATTWRVWVPGYFIFALWGLACFVLMLLMKGPGQLQLAGGRPPDISLAIAAIVLAQGLRIEGPRKARD